VCARADVQGEFLMTIGGMGLGSYWKETSESWTKEH